MAFLTTCGTMLEMLERRVLPSSRTVVRPIAPYADVHRRPQGPGDARPTAMQIVDDENLINKWHDKTVLITGGSSGIGVETARALHATGAQIFFTTRNLTQAKEVCDDIIRTSPSKREIEVLYMDLGSLTSVRDAAADFLRRSNRLNVLINNAGVMGAPFGKTADGFEIHFGVNHLSHFLLTQLLLPTLVASSSPSFASRVVNVSSMGHHHSPGGLSNPNIWQDLNFEKSTYDPRIAYGRSKTANILHTNQIERLYGSDLDHPVHAFSLHPGGITTKLWRHYGASPEEAYKNGIWKSPEQGAATTVWCAVAGVWEGNAGTYCEDCQESYPDPPGRQMEDRGYAPWAKDQKAEQRLWVESEKIIEGVLK